MVPVVFGTAWLMVTVLLGLVPSWGSLLPPPVIPPPSEQLLRVCDFHLMGHWVVALPGWEDLLNVIQVDSIPIFQLPFSASFPVDVRVSQLPVELGEVQLFRLQVPGGTTRGQGRVRNVRQRGQQAVFWWQ